MEILTLGVLRSVAVLRAATRPPSLEAAGSAGAGGGLALPPPDGGGGGGGGGAPPPDGGSGGGAGGAGAPEGADCVGTWADTGAPWLLMLVLLFGTSLCHVPPLIQTVT